MWGEVLIGNDKEMRASFDEWEKDGPIPQREEL